MTSQIYLCKQCWQAHTQAGPNNKPPNWQQAKGFHQHPSVKVSWALNPVTYWVSCPYCPNKADGLVTLTTHTPSRTIYPIAEMTQP